MVPGSPLAGVDIVLADLDGVIYEGDNAIDHAVESMNAAASDLPIGYITNNASRTAASVAEHLSRLGLSVGETDVVTSPQAAVRLLADTIGAGSTVLVVGGEGLVVEVERAGFVVTRSANDSPAAVIQGFHPTVGWPELAEASFALHAGIPWIATNTDWTIPVARGIAPGNGTLVSAVHSAVGRLPVVAGKPEVPIFTEAMRRFAVSTALFLGDRLDTDILGANRAGLTSALVLTGIDRAKQVLAADAKSRPTYLLDDLRQLHEPYPVARDETDSTGHRRVHVGDAVVSMVGSTVRIDAYGRKPIDLLRAGATAIWGSGLAIYGLDVPEALYV
ncbi:HAD-IIA family hydrolase [Marisediminicola sp. LYQ134]|uniref:HAD-IIA family hydrolase n=1 Tax=Marisediminicola sp. LYQ134 TaxID=3391061 RepID=UPI003983BFE5